MPDAKARGWGDPSARNYRTEHIVAVSTAGTTLYVRREVAHLLMGFLQEILARGYKLNNVRDDWGFAYRPIRGYEKQWANTHDTHWLSNHSWGLAVDLDATDHPMGKRGTGIPAWVVEVAHKWGLSWGGDYVNRPDEMHFEFLGTPADVARYPLAGPQQPVAPTPLPPAVIRPDSLENAMRITIPVRVDEHRGYADLTKGYAGLPKAIGADQVLALTYAGADPDPGTPGGADASWKPHATAPLELVDHGSIARIVIPSHEVGTGVITVYAAVAD